MSRNYTLLFFLLAVLVGACTFTKKIKTGEQAYDIKQYSIAVQMLSEEYKNTNYINDKARKAYLLGSSYEYMNDVNASLHWYKQANDHNFGTEASEKYAESLKKNQQYAEAAQVYQNLLKNNQGALKYRQQITLCEIAEEWNASKNSSQYKVTPLNFNTPASDYSPYVMGPNQLAFTSDRTASTGEDLYSWTGNHFSDLFIVETSSNLVETLDPIINSPDNEGNLVFNSDRSEMYFTRCFSGETYDAYCKIMMSTRRGQGWADPVELPFTKEGINYKQAILTQNDSTLFLAGKDDEVGAGGYDIYFSQRGENGWGALQLLGSRINTIGNETFPTLHKDTLYFSSDQHPGMGGLDIFKTWIGSDGNWVPVQNLQPPINSGWDDFSFAVDTFARLRGSETLKGYFSSSRENGQGGDDIYAFTKAGKVIIPGEDVPTKPDRPVADIITFRVYVAIKVMEPILENPENPNSARTGFRPLKNATVEANAGPKGKKYKTDDNGYLIMELDFNREYDFSANYPEHFRNAIQVSTKNIPRDSKEPTTTLNKEIVLDPIFRNVEIVLGNIYYDLDESYIRDDAKPVLDSLSILLQQNPELKIEMGSHTDCRADDVYNALLSQRRAQAAVTYLSQNGINARRLTARGYGESNYAVDCNCADCSEEEHQANRRTTFKIVD